VHKIKKVTVSTGVFWVEIEEIGLYVLCASPADSVKHLSKRGLIRVISDNGAIFESGPNAILLSDSMLQNGEFSNLAEFPVLQMLYKQGMLIPNHPNNNGTKPILIGSQEQVDSQLEYIYRGNYGLTSIEEIVACGIEEGEARELMAIKLKFAFGAIKESQELLDSRVIAHEAVEICRGAWVKRIDSNVFEFSYQDEVIRVDLNLQKDQNYLPPYNLGYYDIKRSYFSVIHSGSGDGWDIDNPCMASIIMYHGKIYIIDAGPNIIYALSSLGIGIEEIEGIFHTHAHDDHFAGISSLLKSDHKIKYFASAPVRASTAKKLSALLKIKEESFYHYFDVIDLELGRWNDIEGLEVLPILSPHPIETNVFYFQVYGAQGYKSYCHLADTVSFSVLSKMVQKDPEDATGIPLSSFQAIKESYLAYADIKKIDCGGGMIHGSILDFEQDPSNRLIIAHKSSAITIEEKKIGSGAPFGTVDTILPSYMEYLYGFAYNFLKSYFPEVQKRDLNAILNNDLITINPESILIKEGDSCGNVFLILTGIGEFIHSGKNFPSRISSGALIGDLFATGKQSSGTYRAVSFMKALKVSSSLFLKFLSRNGLYDQFLALEDIREYLERSWLFGEAISFLTQITIARSILTETLIKDQVYVFKNTPYLHIIKSGSLTRYMGDFVVGCIECDDFFGEDSSIFKEQSIHHVIPDTDTEIYKIPGSLLAEVPIIRWKLLEIHKKRKGFFL